MHSVRPGDHLGQYVLVRAVGSGGMGVVYEARHRSLGRRVAIKVLYLDISAEGSASSRTARFLREGRAAAQVRHAHVVDVFDFGMEQEVPFLVMEFVEGETLADRIRREGALPLPELVELLLPVVSAVATLHAAGIVHRDLKPSNILLARDGANAACPKVADFGVSRFDDGSPSMTASGEFVGTYAYMAPELVRGSKHATEQTDQYALGAMLYACATGTEAFAQTTPYELLHAILHSTVVPPSARNPLLPRAFEGVVLRAMSREPSSRFVWTEELGQALLPFATHTVRERWAGEFDAPASARVPASSAVSRVPAQGPVLFGRDAELASARAAIARVSGGQSALLLIAGEAGIGKTSLADAFAAAANDAGMAVAWGRCWETGGTPPYWPWTQVFRALGIEDPLVAASDASAAEAPDMRFRLFDRAAETLRAASVSRPIAVVLDDLHAADVPSLLFLHLLARGLRSGGRLAVLGTYREAEARVAGEAGTLLAKVAREGELHLPARLTRGDVETWVRTRQPAATDSTIGRVHALSEGNPLFVEELLRAHASLDSSRLPDGLTAAIGEHLGHVSPATRALLAVASVFGREWTQEEVVALAGDGGLDARACIAEARAAGLVIAASAQDRYAFAHVLIRERLYAELEARRRAELHARAGERFAACGALAVAAHHLLESGPGERAASVALEAARLALRTLAFEDAARLASRGAQAAPAPSELSCELDIALAESLIRAGDRAGGNRACVRATSTAKQLGLPLLMAQAALAYGSQWGIVDPIMVNLLREALAALPPNDSALRARTMARLSIALSPPQRGADAQELTGLARDAVAMGQRLADDDTMLFVLRFAGSSVLGPLVSPAERFEMTRQTIELATRLERHVILFDRGPWWVGLLRERGLRADADAALDAYLRLAREFPQPHYRWRPPLVLASQATLDGDFDRADRLAAEGLALAEEADAFQGHVSWATQRLSQGLVYDDRRALAVDADRILRVAAQVESVAPWARISAAVVLAAVGREPEARQRLSRIEIDPGDFPAALVAGHLPMLLRDRVLGERMLPVLLEARTRIPFFWMTDAAVLFGPAARLAGEIAALLGRADEARALLDEAVEGAERLGSPPLVALTRARRASCV